MLIEFGYNEVAIAQARFALLLATESMRAAVDAFLRRHGYTAAKLARQIAPTYHDHGRIEAIKRVREILECDLTEGMHLVDSLNDRFDLRNYSRLYGEGA